MTDHHAIDRMRKRAADLALAPMPEATLAAIEEKWTRAIGETNDAWCVDKGLTEGHLDVCSHYYDEEGPVGPVAYNVEPLVAAALVDAPQDVVALIAEVKRLRAPVVWSRKPPAEPGWYWTVWESHHTDEAPVWTPVWMNQVVDRDGDGTLGIMNEQGGWEPLDAVRWWGPRMQEPRRPQEGI
jgi:hypothetical protein